jgi:hypothetical protein
VRIDERDIQTYLYAFAPRRDHLILRVQRVMNRTRRYRSGHPLNQVVTSIRVSIVLAALAIMLFFPAHLRVAQVLVWFFLLSPFIIGGTSLPLQVRIGQRMAKHWPAALARQLRRQGEESELVTQLLSASHSGGLGPWLILFSRPMIRRPFDAQMPWYTLLRINPETLFILTDRHVHRHVGVAVAMSVLTVLAATSSESAARYIFAESCAGCGGELALVIYLWRVVHVARRRRGAIACLLGPEQSAACGQCGYDLRGCVPHKQFGLTVRRCPECGGTQRCHVSTLSTTNSA